MTSVSAAADENAMRDRGVDPIKECVHETHADGAGANPDGDVVRNDLVDGVNDGIAHSAEYADEVDDDVTEHVFAEIPVSLAVPVPVDVQHFETLPLVAIKSTLSNASALASPSHQSPATAATAAATAAAAAVTEPAGKSAVIPARVAKAVVTDAEEGGDIDNNDDVDDKDGGSANVANAQRGCARNHTHVLSSPSP